MKDKHWLYWHRYFGKRLEWFVCLQAGPWWTLKAALWLAGPIIEISVLFFAIRFGRWRLQEIPLVDVSWGQIQGYTWQQAGPTAEDLTYTASGNKTVSAGHDWSYSILRSGYQCQRCRRFRSDRVIMANGMETELNTPCPVLTGE